MQLTQTPYRSALDMFKQMMRERKAYPAGSPDHVYRSRTARVMVWMMKGLSPAEYPKNVA